MRGEGVADECQEYEEHEDDRGDEKGSDISLDRVICLGRMLDRISIAAPCSADWDSMPGSDRVRHCGQCNKNVYNLSEMTRRQAEALIREKEGQLCARLYRRADGTILTS